MKTSACTFLALAAANQASAFVMPGGLNVARPSAAMKMSVAGVDVETGGKPFDPLGLGKWAPAEFMDRAELANSRAAMLAVVGWAWPEFFGRFASDDVTSSHGLDALVQTAPIAWIQIIALCGIIEGQMWRHRQSGSTAPFFDPLKLYPSDPAKQLAIRRSEIKNGRLAMIGWASFVAHALIPESVPGFPLPF